MPLCCAASASADLCVYMQTFCTYFSNLSVLETRQLNAKLLNERNQSRVRYRGYSKSTFPKSRLENAKTLNAVSVADDATIRDRASAESQWNENARKADHRSAIRGGKIYFYGGLI